jgi:hypothetical protein
MTDERPPGIFIVRMSEEMAAEEPLLGGADFFDQLMETIRGVEEGGLSAGGRARRRWGVGSTDA